jgi:translation initiation factor IF-1
VMRENAQVNEMWGNAQVNVMLENAQVNEMWENSQVKKNNSTKSLPTNENIHS